MKIKKSRRLTFWLCILLSILLISGCSLVNKKRIPTTSERNMYQDKQLTPATLTIYLPGYEPDGAKMVLAEIENQLRPTLNVKLDFRWVPEGAYSDKIQYLMDNSKPLDAFILSKDTYNDEIGEMADKGKLLDITPYFERSVPKLYEMYPKEALKNVTYDGKIMAVPSLLPNINRIAASILANQAQYTGIETPDIKNFEDVKQFASQIKNIQTDKSTVELFADAARYVHIGYDLVYRLDDAEMKTIPWEQTLEFQDAVKTIDEWQKNQYCERNSTLSDGRKLYKKSAFQLYHPSMDFFLTSWDEAQRWTHQYGRDEFKLNTLPLYMDKISTISLTTKAISIPKSSKNGERLLQFLQWVQSSQKHYDLLIYGIKGENYNLENNVITFPKDKPRYFGWDSCDTFMNINYIREENNDGNSYKDMYKSLIEKAKYPPTTGFRINIAKIQSLLEKRKNDFDDFEFKLRSSDFGDAATEIDKFISDQKTSGVDVIVNEIQKQLDEWSK